MAFHKAWYSSSPLTMIVCLFVCLVGFAPSLSAQTKVDFVKNIKPILEANCMACHNEDKDEGGFRMDDRETLLDEWVYAEEASESPLMVDYVQSTDKDLTMPPPVNSRHWEEGLPTGPLDDSDIAMLVKWIDEGADWPEDVELVVPAPDAEEDMKDRPAPKANPWNAIGSLHPAAIHLPIGLLLVAGLFALLGLRGNFVMSDCAYYCLWFGTIFAIIGCVTGWWYAPMKNAGWTVTEMNDLMDQQPEIFWHRTSALVATVFAFLLCLFAAGARNKDPDDGFLWKLGCIILAGGIGWVGHLGGELTYGKSHYKDLTNTAEAITTMDINNDGLVAEWEEAEPAAEEDMDKDDEMDKEEGAEPAVGDTSEETEGVIEPVLTIE